MISLSGDLLKRCEAVLKQCREFDSHENLRTVFDVDVLVTYQDHLPEVKSRGSRVTETISYLLKKQTSSHESVFLLFLRALLEKYDENDQRHTELQSLLLAVSREVGPTASELEKEHQEKEQKDEHALVSGYHSAIVIARDQLSSTLTIFMSGEAIYSEHCQDIRDGISTLGQPVQGLLDLAQRLSQTVSTIPISYPLSRALNSVEEPVNKLPLLLKPFEDVCRTPSKHAMTLREGIQRELGALVGFLNEIDNLCLQLVNHFQQISSNTPLASQPVAPSVNMRSLPCSVPPHVNSCFNDLTDPSDENVIKLCSIIHKKYNYDEFIRLCRRFGKSYADLGEGELETRMLYFIDYCVRHGKYSQLIIQIRKLFRLDLQEERERFQLEGLES